MSILRTPTRAEGGITPSERKEMENVAEKWTRNALKTGPVDKKKLREAIYGLYKNAGLEKPRVAIAPSPLAMALAYGIAASWWYLKRKNEKLPRIQDVILSWGKNEPPLYAETVNTVTQILEPMTSPEMTSHGADASVRAWFPKLCAAFLGEKNTQLGIECAERWSSVYQGGNMWSGFLAYADAMKNVIGLTGLDCWEKYQAYEDAGVHGGFRVMHGEFCIVSEFPLELHADAAHRPHHDHGPSHRWRDGFEIYHLHGVRFPKDLYLKVISREMTASEILQIANVDQRTQAIRFAKSGFEEFFKDEKGEVIDRYTKYYRDEKIPYELWRIPAGRMFDATVHFMLYDCPSSIKRGERRQHCKGVPAFDTVPEAMAWGMSDEECVLTPDQWKELIPLVDES